MAFWDKITSRGNVDDRRGSSGGMRNIGFAGIIMVGLITYFSGGGVGEFFNNLQSMSGPTVTEEQKAAYQGKDEYEVFVSTVIGTINDMYKTQFSLLGKTYTEPTLVLFRGSTQSLCGGAYSSSGPHYCPADQTIYLDETFFEQLTNTLGAHGGDVAQAYVIAHEAGHHAQHLLGLLSDSKSNSQSIKDELQADCFAGVWAHSLKDQQVFELNEISEAIDAAKAVGDDAIQQKIEGRITPEDWTHGSSMARMNAFTGGYEKGALNQCK